MNSTTNPDQTQAENEPYFRISVYPAGERSNAEARLWITNWSEFASWLSQPVESFDKHHQAFCAAFGISPGRGGRPGTLPAGVWVGEYDDNATPELLERAKAWAAQYDALIYFSASATPANPRFRIVVRPSRELAGKPEYAAITKSVERDLGVEMPREAHQSNQVWYRPITATGQRRKKVDGALVPADDPREGKLLEPITGPLVFSFRGRAIDVDAAVRAFPPTTSKRKPAKLGGPPVVGRGYDDEEIPAEIQAVSVYERAQQALAYLQTRKSLQLFEVARIVAHDYAVPMDLAHVCVRAYSNTFWTDPATDEAIADRLSRARENTQGECGNALKTPVAAVVGITTEEGQRRLTENVAAIPSDAEIVVLCAPQGCGKTYHAKLVFDKAGSALYVTDTRALERDGTKRFGGLSYRSKNTRAKKATTTFQSLAGYDDLSRFDLLILDEAPALERQIHSSVTRSRRRVFQSFVDALTKPRRVWLMAADIAAEDIERWKTYAPHRRWHVVDLDMRGFLPREAFVTNRATCKTAIADAICEPGRYVLFSDSPWECEAYRKLIENAGKRAIVVHGHDRSGMEHLNVVGAWDWLIATHAMAAGVSVDIPVDRKFILRSHRFVAPDTIAQQLGRARKLRDPRVIVGQPDWEEDDLETDPCVVREELKHRGIERRLFAQRGDDEQDLPIDELILDSAVAVEIKRRRALNSPGLVGVCQHNGWSLTYDPAPLKRTPKRVDEMLKPFKDMVKEFYIDAVLRARVLTDFEGSCLERSLEDLDSEEDAALARWKLESFVGKTAWSKLDRDIIWRNRSGAWIDGIKNYCRVLDQDLAVGSDHEFRGALPEEQGHTVVTTIRRHLLKAVGGCKTEVEVEEVVRGFIGEHAGWYRRQLGSAPDAGEELPWLRMQLARFGVVLRTSKGAVSFALPRRELFEQHAKTEGLRLRPILETRGRPRGGWDRRKATALASQGVGVREIARRVGVSPDTISRFLRP